MESRMKAIVGGSVLKSTGERFIEKGVILIRGKNIVNVGETQQVPVPEEAEVISAEGKYVVPGLVDAHNHLYLNGEVELGKSFEEMSIVSEEVIILNSIRNARKQLRDGVTTLRDCGSPKFLNLAIKQAISEELVPGPYLICPGQWITPSHGHGAFPGACTIADGPDEIRKAVRETLKRGADFIKVMVSGGNATPWTRPDKAYLGLDELKVVVYEAHSKGKQVAAHIHGGPGTRFAIEAGIDTLEHGPIITDDAEIDLMASRNVAWMFNQGRRVADPDPKLPESEKQKALDYRKTVTLAFQKARKAGVKIMSGADAYHDNHACVWALEALVKCGATPQEALLAGTRTPAEVIGIGQERGTLEPGKFADLLIVDGNPLKNISALRNLSMVMKEGKVYRDL